MDKKQKHLNNPINPATRIQFAEKAYKDAMRLEQRYQRALDTNDSKTYNSLFYKLSHLWKIVRKGDK